MDSVIDRLVIDDSTLLEHPDCASGPRGLTPRTVGSSAIKPFDLKLIPRVEWPERIRDRDASKSRLSDIVLGKGLKSKDQNDPKYRNSRSPRWGYCWMYSAVTGVEAVRAVANLPTVVLSAFGAAYTLKNGADEGAWGALALQFIMERGVPSEEKWPNFAASMSYNNAEVWADAAKYKVSEAWVDLDAPVYDRNLTLDQKMTLLLSGVPVINDYMWWGHAVCSFDPVDADPRLDLMDPNRWASRDRNTWGDAYGDRGFFLVKGQRCVPDNAVAPRSVLAA